MDTGTTIIAIILLLICIMPFMIMYIKSSRKEKQILNALSTAASDQHLKINEQDVWHETGIGIDHAENVLFFIRNNNDSSESINLSLHEVQHCKKIIESRTPLTARTEPDMAVKLALSFTLREKAKDDIVLEFFNSKLSGLTISNEYLLLEKWHHIIQQKLTELSLTTN